MGLLQVSRIFAAREILHHAAARAARARTVGFNRWMVIKSGRVAAIPNAGVMTEPVFDNVDQPLRDMVNSLSPGELWEQALGVVPSSQQFEIERVRIPEYMASENHARAGYILDYAGWSSVGIPDIESGAVLDDGSISAFLHAEAHQHYSLTNMFNPIHRSFYAADTVSLEGHSHLENHYLLYIDDEDL